MKYKEEDYVGGFKILPTGKYLFQILEVPVAKRYDSSKGKPVLTFKFELRAIMPDGETEKFKTSMPSWEASRLWQHLGFKKNQQGEWDFDEKELVGKKFDGEIVHEPDRNNPKRIWAKITNIPVPDDVEEEDTDGELPEPTEKEEDMEEEEEEEDLPF